MTLKDIDFSVAMYGTTPIIQSNYDVAYTGDESSINLRFAVTDEPDLEGATAIVHLKFADSSHIERALELTESVFSYTLKGTENKHAGVVRADIIITKGGAKFTRAGHKFKIDTSLDASVPLVEFSVDTLDTLVDGAEEWLLQAQIDFGTAQSQRAEEWVADNDARADEFAESQTDRTNAFDASEAARTTDFNASETGRSNTFTVNENAREAAAESGEAARDESFELSEYERTTTFGESEAGRVITFNGSEAGRTIAFNLAEEARSEGYANDHDRAGTDHTRAENDHDIALTDQENYVTLLTDLQETINDANENIAEFDVALQNGIVATNIAAELQNLEETYAPDLFTVKKQLAQAQADLQAGIGAVTADAEVVTARISTVKGKTFTVLDARLEDIEADTTMMGTNLVTNGDFSNGTVGWVSANTNHSVANNTLISTADGTNMYAQEYSILGLSVVGDKYYLNLNGRVTNSDCTKIRVYYGGLSVERAKPVANTWYQISGVITATTTNGTPSIFHQYVDAATATGKTMEIKYVSLINLTKTFGAGKEPTLAEMDRLMARFPNSWFDGVKPIQTIETLYQEKANKRQEEWITPTLLNGWINHDVAQPLQYRKDEFGKIHFRGRVGGGSANSAIIAMPVGYKPIYTGEQLCSKYHTVNATIGSARVTYEPGGSVMIYTTSTISERFDLSALTFSAN